MTKANKRRPRTFGSNLRAAREAAGLTQQVLADRLQFKRTTPICLWERGTKVPEPQTIVKLAKAIGCKPAVLLADVVTDYDRLRGVVLDTNVFIALGGDDPPADVTALAAVARALYDRFPVLIRSTLAMFEETARAAAVEGAPAARPADGRYRARRQRTTAPRSTARDASTPPHAPQT